MNAFVWALRMAWRDSRGSRRRMFAFVLSMVLGVAALVSINSFGDNLRDAIDEQARELLGADLQLESRTPFTETGEDLIRELGGEQSRRTTFGSMAYFPSTGGTRIATVRGLEKGFPYYGAIETDPAEASGRFRDGANAVIDGSLMQQFGVAVGDSVQIGSRRYEVAGRILKTPRESAAFSLVSPRIMIPLAEVDTTLLSRGSFAEYEVYIKYPAGTDVEELLDPIKDELRAERISFDTVAEVQGEWDEVLSNVYRFLGLAALVALLLGSLGVASAVHVHVRQRIHTVAVLRCYGGKSWQTFAVFLVQAAAMGLTGSVLGAALGVAVQYVVPGLVADFLPVDVHVQLSWTAIGLGVFVGTAVTVLFALLPLLAVRRISPLEALRTGFTKPPRRDALRYGVTALIAAGVITFAVLQAPTPLIGLAYAGTVGAVLALTTLTGLMIVGMARRFAPRLLSFVLRQGLANLHRPNNQTKLMIVAVGLGTFLIATTFLVQHILLNQIRVTDAGGRPNVILFDIQQDQLEGVTKVVEARDMPVVERVPIVTMRLKSVKGRTIQEMRDDPDTDITWAHRREYRSTYRDTLTTPETLVEGSWIGTATGGLGGVIPVSIEAEISRELDVALGDTLVFDVQGVPVTTTVASIREVDWQRIQTNFFVVFPKGVLEDAPQFFVLVTRAETEAESGALQAQVVQGFPNVSAIDLSLILDVFDEVFSRVAAVIRFLALFSVLTGLIVLTAAVMVSRFQRIEETVLLKTLGASRRQVIGIMTSEYLFLGLIAALSGVVLSLAATWLLSRYVFEAPYVVSPSLVAIVVTAVVALTVLIGHLASRGIYRRPTLEVLRAEV